MADLTGATNAATGTSGASGAGNEQLSQAFDEAIAKAAETLAITTKKGADLYALKQRPQ
ncbi:MAG: hypothetical protein R3D02_08995 [Hyphomicrobiales bacterium]